MTEHPQPEQESLATQIPRVEKETETAICKKARKHKLTRHFRNKKPRPEQMIFLENLPAEILLCVVDHLPLASAAILAVCSPQLLQKLGTGPFERVARAAQKTWPVNTGSVSMLKHSTPTPEQKHWIIFLTTLAEKFPDMIFCHYCRQIHGPDETDVLDPNSKRICSKAESNHDSYSWLGIHNPAFTFSRVQVSRHSPKYAFALLPRLPLCGSKVMPMLT